ncbi:MAG: LytR C-terminal domain-containing protein, partial [Acidobacteriota bacterium]|nr:LytR C-terminal domain-containing protein [Acidobacteriota bacterium]
SRPRFPPTPAPASVPAPAARAHAGRPDAVEQPAGRRAGNRNGHELPDPSEFRFLREDSGGRSRGPLMLAALGALVVVVLIVLLASSGGGSQPATGSTSGATHTTSAHSARTSAPAAASANSPESLRVTVLNSTEISGLAHRLASQLQQQGYKHAEAQNGRPEGSFSTSTVEYAAGFSAAAERIARSLAIEASAVKPLESGSASVAGGASIVVIAAGTGAGSAAESTTATSTGEAGTAAQPAAEGGGEPGASGG